MDFPRIPDAVLRSIIEWNPEVAWELASFLRSVSGTDTVEGNACHVAGSTIRAMLLSIDREKAFSDVLESVVAEVDLPPPPP